MYSKDKIVISCKLCLMTNQKPFYDVARGLDVNRETEKREVTGCIKTT